MVESVKGFLKTTKYLQLSYEDLILSVNLTEPWQLSDHYEKNCMIHYKFKNFPEKKKQGSRSII